MNYTLTWFGSILVLLPCLILKLLVETATDAWLDWLTLSRLEATFHSLWHVVLYIKSGEICVCDMFLLIFSFGKHFARLRSHSVEETQPKEWMEDPFDCNFSILRKISWSVEFNFWDEARIEKTLCSTSSIRFKRTWMNQSVDEWKRYFRLVQLLLRLKCRTWMNEWTCESYAHDARDSQWNEIDTSRDFSPLIFRSWI